MYKINDVVKCVVTGFKEYGIFVKVDNVYDGLIHISEISDSFVKDVKDYSEIGDIIYAEVIDIDMNSRHFKLTIKNLNYKIDGKPIYEHDRNGFRPLKNNLNIWINEKLQEINNK